MKLLSGSNRLVQLSLLFFLLSATSHGQSRDLHHDTQVWNDTQVAFALNKQIDFVLLGTLRFGREVTRPVDERIGAAISFKVGTYLTLAPGYLYIATQPFKNTKGFENRLFMFATVKFPIGHGFVLSDRNLFERRIRHPQIDATRYRNRLQIEHPFKLGSLKLNGFMSDEVFHDWSVNAWVRNRFAIGAGHTFNKHATLEVYYLRQNDSHTRPGDLDVVGTTLRLRAK